MLLEKVDAAVPCFTCANTKWAVSTWTSWRAERKGEKPPELINITNQQLSECLPLFVPEARRRDGEKYPGNTLHNLRAAMQCFVRDDRLHKNGSAVDIFSKADSTFALFRKVLDSEMKELRAAGVGLEKKWAQPISLSEEEKLWEQRLLGDSIPHVLTDTCV